jgi:hypothetical protein
LKVLILMYLILGPTSIFTILHDRFLNASETEDILKSLNVDQAFWPDGISSLILFIVGDSTVNSPVSTNDTLFKAYYGIFGKLLHCFRDYLKYHILVCKPHMKYQKPTRLKLSMLVIHIKLFPLPPMCTVSMLIHNDL